MNRSLGSLVVVFCVAVGLLAALVGALTLWSGSDPRYGKTEAIVKMLEDGCETYRGEYGAYPPGNTQHDSSTLVRHLGAPRGSRPPIIEFSPDLVLGGRVMDQWGRPVRYANPGTHNPKGVDIWSLGRNGVEELDPTLRNFDDVVNWSKIAK